MILDVLAGRTHLKGKGHERHGPCPLCGGRDRFVVWPDANRAWCRQCNEGGSAQWWNWKLNGVPFKNTGSISSDAGTTKPSAVIGIRPKRKLPRVALPAIRPPTFTPCPPELLEGCKTAEFRAALEAADDDRREWLDERVGIAEFDGGLERREAELEILKGRV